MTTRQNAPAVVGLGSPSRRSVLATLSVLPVLVAAAPAAAASGTPSATAAPVAVDPSAVRQTIRGFGGMNHPVWPTFTCTAN